MGYENRGFLSTHSYFRNTVSRVGHNKKELIAGAGYLVVWAQPTVVLHVFFFHFLVFHVRKYNFFLNKWDYLL